MTINKTDYIGDVPIIAIRNFFKKARNKNAIFAFDEFMASLHLGNALNRLCDILQNTAYPVLCLIKGDTQLKSIDIMHFGRNIGKAFGKQRLQTATFI